MRGRTSADFMKESSRRVGAPPAPLLRDAAEIGQASLSSCGTADRTAIRLSNLRETLKETRAALGVIGSGVSPGGEAGRSRRPLRSAGRRPTAETSASRYAENLGTPAASDVAGCDTGARRRLAFTPECATTSCRNMAALPSQARQLAAQGQAAGASPGLAEHFNLGTIDLDSPSRSLAFTIEGIYETGAWAASPAAARAATSAPIGVSPPAGFQLALDEVGCSPLPSDPQGHVCQVPTPTRSPLSPTGASSAQPPSASLVSPTTPAAGSGATPKSPSSGQSPSGPQLRLSSSTSKLARLTEVLRRGALEGSCPASAREGSAVASSESSTSTGSACGASSRLGRQLTPGARIGPGSLGRRGTMVAKIDLMGLPPSSSRGSYSGLHRRPAASSRSTTTASAYGQKAGAAPSPATTARGGVAPSPTTTARASEPDSPQVPSAVSRPLATSQRALARAQAKEAAAVGLRSPASPRALDRPTQAPCERRSPASGTTSEGLETPSDRAQTPAVTTAAAPPVATEVPTCFPVAVRSPTALYATAAPVGSTEPEAAAVARTCFPLPDADAAEPSSTASSRPLTCASPACSSSLRERALRLNASSGYEVEEAHHCRDASAETHQAHPPGQPECASPEPAEPPTLSLRERAALFEQRARRTLRKATEQTTQAAKGAEELGSSQEDAACLGEGGLSLRERVALLERCELKAAQKIPTSGPEAPSAPVPSLKERVALLEKLFEQRSAELDQQDRSVKSDSEEVREGKGSPSKGSTGKLSPGKSSGKSSPRQGTPQTNGGSSQQSPGSGQERPSPGKGKGKTKGPPKPTLPLPPKAAASPGLKGAGPKGAGHKGAGAKVASKGHGPGPRRPEVTPASTMKRLFWNSFFIDAPETPGTSPTVWGTIEQEGVDGFDAAELERLFSERQQSKGKAQAASTSPAAPASKIQTLRVFEESRRRQVCIMLARLPAVESIVAAVTAMDDSKLNKDQVELLLATSPSAEELATLHKAAPDPAEAAAGEDVLTRWDDAEAFVLQLGSVPSFALRLQIWAFENSFEERFDIFRSAARDIVGACTAMQSSKQVVRLLALSLQVGNYLNAGTTRGRADGFTVDCLAQMRNVKANLQTGIPVTLLDFVVFHLERSQPGGLELVFLDGGEADAVRAASRHKLADLSSELAAFCQQADSLAKRATASSGDAALAERGARAQSRQLELVALKDELARAEQAYAELCVWLHEGCAGSKQARPPEELFGAWSDFLSAVRSSLEKIYSGHARRRKAEVAQAHRPLGKIMESFVAEGAKSFGLEESIDLTLASHRVSRQTRVPPARASRSCPPGRRASAPCKTS